MTGPARNRTTELTGAELDRLRKVYADRDVLVSTITGRFGLCAAKLLALAVQEGWPLRRATGDRKETVDG